MRQQTMYYHTVNSPGDDDDDDETPEMSIRSKTTWNISIFNVSLVEISVQKHQSLRVRHSYKADLYILLIVITISR